MKSIQKRLFILAVAVVVLGAVTTALTGLIAPVEAGVIGGVGLWGMGAPELLKRLTRPYRIIAAIVAVISVIASGLIDGVGYAAIPLVLSVGVGALWRQAFAAFTPAAALSPAVLKVLDKAGFVVTSDGALGWTAAARASGAVILIREIPTQSGPPETWKKMAQLRAAASSAHQAMSSQGIEPLIVAVTPATALTYTTTHLTVTSLDRLGALLAASSSSVKDPRALAREAGITLSRDAARRAGRVSPRPSRAGAPVHRGRVTDKKARPET